MLILTTWLEYLLFNDNDYVLNYYEGDITFNDWNKKSIQWVCFSKLNDQLIWVISIHEV